MANTTDEGTNRFFEFLNDNSIKYNDFIVGGDFNINYLKNKSKFDIIENCFNFNDNCCIHYKPKCESKQIDLFFSKNIRNVKNYRIKNVGISYREVILITY